MRTNVGRMRRTRVVAGSRWCSPKDFGEQILIEEKVTEIERIEALGRHRYFLRGRGDRSEAKCPTLV
jgi:hypothetical protein